MTRKDKEAFKKRMAAGRRKAAKERGDKPNPKKRGKKKTNPNARKTKKKIAKGFGRQLAAEHVRAKKKAAKRKRSVTHRSPNGRGGSHVTARAKKNAGGSHKKKNRRRNQEPGSIESAARQYESFHGKPAGRISEYDLQTRYPEHFAELGKLIELRIMLDEANPDFAFTGFGNCKLVSTPDGANLYFIGGDQSIDLAALNIASDKDFVELGYCHYISYHTVKGFHDFEPTTYYHEFGEEDGIVPCLVYDRLNQRLFLASGNYRVRPEGIVN